MDSCVWIDYLDASPRGIRATVLLDGNRVHTTAITLAEVIAKTKKHGKNTTIAIQAIRSKSRIIDVDAELGMLAGDAYPELKRMRPKISLSDVIALCAARRLGGHVLSADHDFKGIKDAIVVE